MNTSFKQLTLTVYYRSQFERTWTEAGMADTARTRSRWLKHHLYEVRTVERAITRAREHGIKEG